MVTSLLGLLIIIGYALGAFISGPPFWLALLIGVMQGGPIGILLARSFLQEQDDGGFR